MHKNALVSHKQKFQPAVSFPLPLNKQSLISHSSS